MTALSSNDGSVPLGARHHRQLSGDGGGEHDFEDLEEMKRGSQRMISRPRVEESDKTHLLNVIGVLAQRERREESQLRAREPSSHASSTFPSSSNSRCK